MVSRSFTVLRPLGRVCASDGRKPHTAWRGAVRVEPAALSHPWVNVSLSESNSEEGACNPLTALAGAVAAGVGAEQGMANEVVIENDSHPPPPESSDVFSQQPNLVGPLKMGGGPGEGEKSAGATAWKHTTALATYQRQKRASAGLPTAGYAVLGELMLHRYPRTVAATAASVGLSRQTVYAVLAKLERWGHVPLVRTPSDDGLCIGVDWQAMRGRA